jgi:hypothetical protein
LVDNGASLVTDAETAKLMQPTIGSLHNPAVYAKSTAMCRISLGDACTNSAFAGLLSMLLRIVGAICVQALWPPSRWSWLASGSG